MRRRKCGSDNFDFSELERRTIVAGACCCCCSVAGCGEATVDRALLIDKVRDCCETMRWCFLLPDEKRRRHSVADDVVLDVVLALEAEAALADAAAGVTSDGPELRQTGCITATGAATRGEPVPSLLNALIDAT